jgi:ATP-dependent Clp protease adapter protein ClpS
MRYVWNNLHHVRSTWGMSGITFSMYVQHEACLACLMLNVHDEGYSRYASCWMYMMKVIPDMPHAERTWWRLFQTCLISCTFSMRYVWNNLHHVRSAWGMSGIIFIMYVQYEACLEFQTCLMLNVHVEGYSRHASCWTYMMKVIPDMPHAERRRWRLFQTCLMQNVHDEGAWGMSGIVFSMYVQHEACLK